MRPAPLDGVALAPWLSRQRWFGGKARAVAAVELVDAVPLGPGAEGPWLALLAVRYREGDAETYTLPLARAPDGGDAVIAGLDVAGACGALRPADHDPAFARALLRAMADGRPRPGRSGALEGSATTAFHGADAGLAGVTPVPLGAEQSNTSLVFGDRAVLKLFRKLEPGANPDVEVGTYLTEVAGFRGSPRVLGALSWRPEEGAPLALAVLQAFVPNRGDAWRHTVEEVGHVLARARGAAPPHADGALTALAVRPPPPALAAIARRSLEDAALLGRRTGELHRALAAHPEVEAFRPEPFADADREALHEEARAVVARGLTLLARRREALDPATRARADRVLAAGDALERRLRAALARPLRSVRIRLHGDYHLGQVLWTGDDFVVVDFEGEPARPLAARRAKGSALRDVAGMIRSFHYAARAGLEAHLSRPGAGDAAHAERWARAWYPWVAARFLGAWLEAARGSPVAPRDPAELRDLLDLFLVEKAVYELAYELGHRPAWVGLPLQGIEDLLAADAAAREDDVPKKGSRELPRAAARTVTARKAAGEAPPPTGHDVVAKGGPSDVDLHLWSEGTNHRAYRTMGAHLATVDGVAGVSFAVWAPNAERVSVMGDWNGWDKDAQVLRPLGPSGVWQGFLPGVKPGATYKYHVRSRHQGHAADKADPFGFKHEAAPGTQSIVADLSHDWGDGAWMASRGARNGLGSPISIYELHLGSWRRVPEDGDRPLGYRELAPRLADHCAEMGFTHVELMPVTEHPFYGSWGYQTTGYFAPTSRYGSPQDFMALVDTLHQRGIGVILDWVPSHFPADAHGLAYFDGTHLFEHADRRQGHHPDWDSYIFNYGRNEVRSFLLSSAMFWLDRYHVDGLRVDAVASMLYLDYSRKEGEWIPNRFGGRENLDAIGFLRRLNEVVFAEHPDVQTVAEESTAWPMVSRPTYLGGLGFGMKWDMGWMHDTLQYLRREPIFRKYHQNELTFRMMYAFSENFVLALSHDEVVHGKGSLLDKMPGDAWQKFANLRLLYGYMWAQPGKKLLFMGGELAQGQEWSHERSLDWHLLGVAPHTGVADWIRDLNRALRENPALHVKDCDPSGFEWVDCNDAETSVVSLLRRGGEADPEILAVFNFTPVPRHAYRVGVPRGGFWREILNSDATRYGGAGFGNLGGQEASPVSAHGRYQSLSLTIPPLGAIFFRRDPG